MCTNKYTPHFAYSESVGVEALLEKFAALLGALLELSRDIFHYNVA